MEISKDKDKAKDKPIHFYTLEQRELLHGYFADKPKAYSILLMVYSGIRCSEMLGLQWRDLTAPGIISVNKSVTEYKNDGKYVPVESKLKAKSYNREVSMPEWLYHAINQLRTDDDRYIFCDQHGKMMPPSIYINDIYKPQMEEMAQHYAERGIQMPILNCHEIRHTAITLWEISGVDTHTILKMSGFLHQK